MTGIPQSLYEQLPVVVLFVLFTTYLVERALRSEATARTQYIDALAEARKDYLQALTTTNSAYVATLADISRELRTLSDGVTRLTATRRK
jgi:hypothetical protein